MTFVPDIRLWDGGSGLLGRYGLWDCCRSELRVICDPFSAYVFVNLLLVFGKFWFRHYRFSRGAAALRLRRNHLHVLVGGSGWSPELEGLCEFGDSRRFIGGRAGDEGYVLRRER